MEIERPSAIFFDLDDTLYPYREAHKAALEAIYQYLPLKQEEIDEAYQRARGEVKKQLNQMPACRSRLLYFKRMNEILQRPIYESVMLEEIYWGGFLKQMRMFPYALDFLKKAREAVIPCVLVTNLTTQIQLRKLEMLGITNLFQAIVTSEEAGEEKPHAAPFLLAAKKLEIPLTVSWMIGDDPSCDLHGAKSALHAITFQRTAHERSEHADYAFSCWRELLPCLDF